MRAQADDRTKAILVNNPSNPCGSCFSKQHCLEILEVADDLKIPIIADEVYYGLAYGEDSEFHSFGNLTNDVPVIVSNLLLKSFSALVRCLKSIAYRDGD